ncbi:MAG TPA: hemerythrin domain-containing protein [Ramlibacter sp.]
MPTLVEKDACELLDADHVAVKHLFVEYARQAHAGAAGTGVGAQAAAAMPDERLALARKICAELTVHATIEEEIFYPALGTKIDEPELLDEARAEHQEAKDLIAQIDALPAADATMDDLVAQLARAIEHHVKEERDQLFPKARASGLDLDAIGKQLKGRQQELQASS